MFTFAHFVFRSDSLPNGEPYDSIGYINLIIISYDYM